MTVTLILENNFLEENVNIPQLRSLAPTSHHRGNIEAVQIRDKLKDYFISCRFCALARW